MRIEINTTDLVKLMFEYKKELGSDFTQKELLPDVENTIRNFQEDYKSLEILKW